MASFSKLVAVANSRKRTEDTDDVDIEHISIKTNNNISLHQNRKKIAAIAWKIQAQKALILQPHKSRKFGFNKRGDVKRSIYLGERFGKLTFWALALRMIRSTKGKHSPSDPEFHSPTDAAAQVL